MDFLCIWPIKRRGISRALYMRLFSLFEVVFACAAEGAFPISGKISKSGTGLYTVVRVAFGGVVNVTTYLAFIFVHVLNSFQLLTCQLLVLYPGNGKSNRGNEKFKKEKKSIRES